MGSHTSADRTVLEIMNSIRRIVRALRVFDAQAQRTIGLSAAQVFILDQLREAGPISVNAIAARTCTDQSSVSTVARKLVDQMLATRSRSRADSRFVELKITPKGRRLLRKAPPAAQQRIIAALRKMPAPRRRQLAERLGELTGAIGLDRRRAVLFFEDKE